MSSRITDEINFELERIVERKMKEDPYQDRERVRNFIRERFAEWIANKFDEESDWT